MSDNTKRVTRYYVHYDDSSTRVLPTGSNPYRGFGMEPDGEYYFEHREAALRAALASVTAIMNNCLRSGNHERAERLRLCQERLRRGLEAE